MTEIIDTRVGNPLQKNQILPSKWYFQNPVCLTFCAVSWSIFGWKVRWVSRSKFRGLFDGYEKFLCMCSRTRENNKNKVKSDFWDTLYIVNSIILMFTRHNTARARDDKEDPPVAEVTHEKERQPPVDSEAGADLPPSYTEVEEGDLPWYNTISEKTRNEV